MGMRVTRIRPGRLRSDDVVHFKRLGAVNGNEHAVSGIVPRPRVLDPPHPSNLRFNDGSDGGRDIATLPQEPQCYSAGLIFANNTWDHEFSILDAFSHPQACP